MPHILQQSTEDVLIIPPYYYTQRQEIKRNFDKGGLITRCHNCCPCQFIKLQKHHDFFVPLLKQLPPKTNRPWHQTVNRVGNEQLKQTSLCWSVWWAICKQSIYDVWSISRCICVSFLKTSLLADEKNILILPDNPELGPFSLEPRQRNIHNFQK